MSMQMDAYLNKKQINTLFVRVGALEGGFWGGGGQGGPAQKLYVPHRNISCLLVETKIFITVTLLRVVYPWMEGWVFTCILRTLC